MSTGFLAIPQDTLFCGPPSAAPAGEVHHAESLFPPPPSAWQGLIRTRLLRAARPPVDLSDRVRVATLVGEPEQLPDGWSIEGPYPVRREAERWEAYYPCPAWVFKGKADSNLKLACPVPVAGTRPLTDQPDTAEAAWIAAPTLGASKPARGWVSATRLLGLLRGGAPMPGDIQEKLDFVSEETRPGLVVEHETGTARQGLLYFQQVRRFQPESGLAGWLTGDPAAPLTARALTEGVAALGRKSRPLTLAPLRDADLSSGWAALRSGAHLSAAGALTESHFWLYLASPVRLPDPARPVLAGTGSVTLTVRAALLHPPLILGGFDLRNGKVRPNRAHVPAGSAWLIELRGGSVAERQATLRQLHDRATLGRPRDRAFGYGRTLVGLLSSGGTP